VTSLGREQCSESRKGTTHSSDVVARSTYFKLLPLRKFELSRQCLQQGSRCYCSVQPINVKPRISPLRKFELSRQCVQQGSDRYCQIQPINMRPRVFTLKTRTQYSRSTTRNEVPPVLPPLLADVDVAKHQSLGSHTSRVQFGGAQHNYDLITAYEALSSSHPRPNLHNYLVVSKFT
jgi:ribosomal protein S14